MRRFIVRSLVFLLPVILFLAGLEEYMRSLPNSYRDKDEWMQGNASSVEILVLGNSHGLFGIKPDCLSKKAYNLCNVSQIFEYDEYLLRRYIGKMLSLTDVILIADNSNFFDLPFEQTDEWFRCIYYRLYMDYPKHSLYSKYGLEISNIPALKKKMQFGHRDACDEYGWNTAYTLANRDTSALSLDACREAAFGHRCRDWAVAEDNRRTLGRIVDLCRTHDVRLILVQAPVMKAYYENIDHRQLLFLKKSCIGGNGVVVADYSQDARFGYDDFFDADHLSDVGARKWSRILNEEFFTAD